MTAVAECFPVPTTEMAASVTQVDDLEIQNQPIIIASEKLDIEHATVQDDPRDWSPSRKVCMTLLQWYTINEYFFRQLFFSLFRPPL